MWGKGVQIVTKTRWGKGVQIVTKTMWGKGAAYCGICVDLPLPVSPITMRICASLTCQVLQFHTAPTHPRPFAPLVESRS